MKNPLVMVGLMAAAGAGIIVAVFVLGNHAPNNLRDTAGLDVSTALTDLGTPGPAPVKPKDRPAVSETGPWPVAVSEKTDFNFGRMSVNSKNEHTFVIRNEGEADLILKEGQPTCKCTTFALESNVLKPGEDTNLVINWKAGDAADREFHHGGDVYTNDPKSPAINFGVNGAIEMPVEILPNIWNVGKIDVDKTGTLRAEIGSKLTDQFELEAVASPSGKVTVNLSPMSAEEAVQSGWLKGYRIDVEIATDILPGKFDEDVRFNVTGIQDLEFVTAALTARKYGSFILQPLDGAMFLPDGLLLQLGQFPASEGRTAKLLLVVDEKDMTDPFRITEIDADPPFITASLVPLGVPTGTVHRYTLEISIPPGRPRIQKNDANRGHITLHTNHPSGETIFTDVLVHSH